MAGVLRIIIVAAVGFAPSAADRDPILDRLAMLRENFRRLHSHHGQQRAAATDTDDSESGTEEVHEHPFVPIGRSEASLPVALDEGRAEVGSYNQGAEDSVSLPMSESAVPTAGGGNVGLTPSLSTQLSGKVDAPLSQYTDTTQSVSWHPPPDATFHPTSFAEGGRRQEDSYDTSSSGTSMDTANDPIVARLSQFRENIERMRKNRKEHSSDQGVDGEDGYSRGSGGPAPAAAMLDEDGGAPAHLAVVEPKESVTLPARDSEDSSAMAGDAGSAFHLPQEGGMSFSASPQLPPRSVMDGMSSEFPEQGASASVWRPPSHGDEPPTEPEALHAESDDTLRSPVASTAAADPIVDRLSQFRENVERMRKERSARSAEHGAETSGQDNAGSELTLRGASPPNLDIQPAAGSEMLPEKAAVSPMSAYQVEFQAGSAGGFHSEPATVGASFQGADRFGETSSFQSETEPEQQAGMRSTRTSLGGEDFAEKIREEGQAQLQAFSYPKAQFETAQQLLSQSQVVSRSSPDDMDGGRDAETTGDAPVDGQPAGGSAPLLSQRRGGTAESHTAVEAEEAESQQVKPHLNLWAAAPNPPPTPLSRRRSLWDQSYLGSRQQSSQLPSLHTAEFHPQFLDTHSGSSLDSAIQRQQARFDVGRLWNHDPPSASDTQDDATDEVDDRAENDAGARPLQQKRREVVSAHDDEIGGDDQPARPRPAAEHRNPRGDPVMDKLAMLQANLQRLHEEAQDRAAQKSEETDYARDEAQERDEVKRNDDNEARAENGDWSRASGVRESNIGAMAGARRQASPMQTVSGFGHGDMVEPPPLQSASSWGGDEQAPTSAGPSVTWDDAGGRSSAAGSAHRWSLLQGGASADSAGTGESADDLVKSAEDTGEEPGASPTSEKADPILDKLSMLRANFERIRNRNHAA